jgi:hypothetical protein
MCDSFNEFRNSVREIVDGGTFKYAAYLPPGELIQEVGISGVAARIRNARRKCAVGLMVNPGRPQVGQWP